MNILFLINFAGKAGIERYVENLVRIFTAEGETCHFAYNIGGELSEKMEKADVPILNINMEKSQIFKAAKTLADYCRENKIDVIHPQCPRENIVALLSLRHYDVPKVVYTNHFTNRVGLVWKLINRVFTKKNYKIIAVCREGREILIENGVCPDRIVVIYNGVSLIDEPKKDKSVLDEIGVSRDTFIMSILARFEPEKGLPFLLDSLNELKSKTDRAFCCLICGDGSEFAEISAKIIDMGLENEVKCLGYRTDTPRILAASDLYLNSSSCNEAMSFAILEALNAGLPCVVTDIGGNRDLAETNSVCGIVCDYGDTGAFSDAMAKLMIDEDLRQEYATETRLKVAREFDLQKLALDVLHSYE